MRKVEGVLPLPLSLTALSLGGGLLAIAVGVGHLVGDDVRHLVFLDLDMYLWPPSL